MNRRTGVVFIGAGYGMAFGALLGQRIAEDLGFVVTDATVTRLGWAGLIAVFIGFVFVFYDGR